MKIDKAIKEGVSLTSGIYQKTPTLWKTRNYLFILAVALV